MSGSVRFALGCDQRLDGRRASQKLGYLFIHSSCISFCNLYCLELLFSPVHPHFFSAPSGARSHPPTFRIIPMSDSATLDPSVPLDNSSVLSVVFIDE